MSVVLISGTFFYIPTQRGLGKMDVFPKLGRMIILTKMLQVIGATWPVSIAVAVVLAGGVDIFEPISVTSVTDTNIRTT